MSKERLEIRRYLLSLSFYFCSVTVEKRFLYILVYIYYRSGPRLLRSLVIIQNLLKQNLAMFFFQSFQSFLKSDFIKTYVSSNYYLRNVLLIPLFQLPPICAPIKQSPISCKFSGIYVYIKRKLFRPGERRYYNFGKSAYKALPG